MGNYDSMNYHLPFTGAFEGARDGIGEGAVDGLAEGLVDGLAEGSVQ